MGVDNRTHSLGADARAPGVCMGGAPLGVAWLYQAGGMSAEAIGYPEDRVQRPFRCRSTSSPPAFAAIIIVDRGSLPQTCVRRPGIRDIAPGLRASASGGRP